MCYYEKIVDEKKDLGPLLQAQEKFNFIIDKYTSKIIPPGTKGVVRGNKFNQIVMEQIRSFDLDSSIYEVAFEKKSKEYPTSEIPDWYIYHKETKKILIGMNQLDLWSGGHQINRAFKYIKDDKNENKKILCVICNHTELKSDRNKTYRIFKTGFNCNSLCYVPNLEKIIKEYFK